MTFEQRIKAEWIERIPKLKEMIKFWETKKSEKKSIAEYSGISYGEKSGSISNSIERRYDEVSNCDEKIAKYKALLKQAEFEVNSAISSIPNEIYREILVKSYIEHKRNEVVAKEVYYSTSNVKLLRLKALDSLNISQWTY